MGSPAAPTRGKVSPRSRGHAKRRVRLLPRARAQQRVAHPVELALEAEPFAAPREAQDLDRLVEPPLALRVGDRVALVEPGEAAPPDPEVDPPAAHVVEGRDLLRDANRVAQGQHVHREADPDPPGAARDRGREGDRRGEHRAVRHEVELREPRRVEPPPIRRLGEGEALPERLRLAAARTGRELHEHAELHRCGLLPGSAEIARTPENRSRSRPSRLCWCREPEARSGRTAAGLPGQTVRGTAGLHHRGRNIGAFRIDGHALPSRIDDEIHVFHGYGAQQDAVPQNQRAPRNTIGSRTSPEPDRRKGPEHAGRLPSPLPSSRAPRDPVARQRAPECRGGLRRYRPAP